VRSLFIGFIKLYQMLISPLLGPTVDFTQPALSMRSKRSVNMEL